MEDYKGDSAIKRAAKLYFPSDVYSGLRGLIGCAESGLKRVLNRAYETAKKHEEVSPVFLSRLEGTISFLDNNAKRNYKISDDIPNSHIDYLVKKYGRGGALKRTGGRIGLAFIAFLAELGMADKFLGNAQNPRDASVYLSLLAITSVYMGYQLAITSLLNWWEDKNAGLHRQQTAEDAPNTSSQALPLGSNRASPPS